MGFLSKFLSSEVIEIRDGRAMSAKGRHPQTMLGAISDVCRDFGVDHGEIGISGNGKYSFSKHVPAAAHQPLRNVIVNHL